MTRRIYYIPTNISFTLEDGTTKFFVKDEEIGRGSFAVVYRVTDQSTKEIYAMKVIPKILCERMSGQKLAERIKNEIAIQTYVNHQNVVKLKYQFSDHFYYYFFLEYCPGKNVREYSVKNEFCRIKESDTIKILKDVINGLIYLHNNDIVHYDLKLENYLMDSNGKVKIADFGLSTFSKNEEGTKFLACGTPNYMSPEVLRRLDREQSYKADIWAIGISAYIMLTGKGPFEGKTRDETFNNIKKCQFEFPNDIEISPEAKDFITSILKEDPLKRPTAKELLNHPFLNKEFTEKVQASNSCNLPQLIKNPQSIQKVQPIEKVEKLPTIEIGHKKANQKNEAVKSPRRSNVSQNRKVVFAACENQNQNNINELKKNFRIPNHFVSRYCFYKEHLAYILGDGTIGVCFKDSTRIVMDPNEEFVQFYRNKNSRHEVVSLNDEIDPENENKKAIEKRIVYVRKIAKYFKKIKASFDLKIDEQFDSAIPLFNVKCYVKNDDSILFKLNDKNIQVNFKDYQKLIIFWNAKKMCFFKNINEKCNLLDIKFVASMNSNSDELRKFKKSKELLSNLAITI